MNKIISFFLVLLLLSVEGSFQSSIKMSRTEAWWTPWLLKVGPQSVADYVIIFIILIVLFRFLKKLAIPKSLYLKLSIPVFIYLLIGGIYNVTVFANWKGYLYDFKFVMFLFIPYMFLYTADNKEKIVDLFSPLKIFIYCSVAGIIDVIIVNIKGHSEQPAILGFISLPEILPFCVSLIGVKYSESLRNKAIFCIIIIIDLLNGINRSSGVLFDFINSIIIIALFPKNYSFLKRFALCAAIIMFINSYYLLLIYLGQHADIPILSAKADGAVNRIIELINVVENYKQNIPVIIGKGFGTTWSEIVQIPIKNIYSVGEFVEKDVKFIFHTGAASMLYKWGIIGSLLWLFMLTEYFHVNYNKIQTFNKFETKNETIQYLEAILLISFIYAINNFSYIGNLKSALITSLLAFNVEYRVKKESKW